jgi:cell division inhibitor SulA/protein ImuA
MGALAERRVRRGSRGDSCRADNSAPVVSSGYTALDTELPGGGWPRGALIELLVDGSGMAELVLLVPALAGIRATGGWSLLVGAPCSMRDQSGAMAGNDLARLAAFSPAAERDALWAAEQALFSGAPDAVLCWGQHADARSVRRLQVAAAAGGSVAFLLRPMRAADEASVAPLRLLLAAGPAGRIAVSVLKRRGQAVRDPIILETPDPRHAHVEVPGGVCTRSAECNAWV